MAVDEPAEPPTATEPAAEPAANATEPAAEPATVAAPDDEADMAAMFGVRGDDLLSSITKDLDGEDPAAAHTLQELIAELQADPDAEAFPAAKPDEPVDEEKVVRYLYIAGAVGALPPLMPSPAVGSDRTPSRNPRASRRCRHRGRLFALVSANRARRAHVLPREAVILTSELEPPPSRRWPCLSSVPPTTRPPALRVWARAADGPVRRHDSPPPRRPRGLALPRASTMPHDPPEKLHALLTQSRATISSAFSQQPVGK